MTKTELINLIKEINGNIKYYLTDRNTNYIFENELSREICINQTKIDMLKQENKKCCLVINGVNKARKSIMENTRIYIVFVALNVLLSVILNLGIALISVPVITSLYLGACLERWNYIKKSNVDFYRNMISENNIEISRYNKKIKHIRKELDGIIKQKENSDNNLNIYISKLNEVLKSEELLEDEICISQGNKILIKK